MDCTKLMCACMSAFSKGDSIRETSGTISEFKFKIEKVSLFCIKILNLDYRVCLKMRTIGKQCQILL